MFCDFMYSTLKSSIYFCKNVNLALANDSCIMYKIYCNIFFYHNISYKVFLLIYWS